MAEQMRAQHAAATSPVIAVNLQIRDEVLINLRIKNSGRATARNLRISLDRDFHQFAAPDPDRNIRYFGIFQNPIPCFPPDEQLLIHLSQGWNLGKVHNDRVITPPEIKIEVAYDHAGCRHTERFEFDLAAYYHTFQDRSETSKELRKIREALEKRL